MISFIILSWNSACYLPACLDAIIGKCAGETISFEIILIDNGSSDDSCRIVELYRERYGDVIRLIALPVNRGTTYPRNLGLKQARGSYLCVLDSDTELGDGSLATILQRLEADNRLGIIAPKLLLPGCVVQNSVKRFPTMLNKLMKIPRIIFGINTRNADFYDDFPFVDEREVESAISACWFFRRELLDETGYLDENIFYSPEDVEFSLRVWKSGHSILYVPTFTVLHHTQQITHKKPFSRMSFSHFGGLLYYFRKHGGWVSRHQ